MWCALNCKALEGNVACSTHGKHPSDYISFITILLPSLPSPSPLPPSSSPSLFLRFYCFVFCSASKEKAYAIVLTVAKAFYLAYQASDHVTSVGVVKQ